MSAIFSENVECLGHLKRNEGYSAVPIIIFTCLEKLDSKQNIFLPSSNFRCCLVNNVLTFGELALTANLARGRRGEHPAGKGLKVST